MNALQELLKKEKPRTTLEEMIYEADAEGYSEFAELAASELAALRKELEEAKAFTGELLQILHETGEIAGMFGGQWKELPGYVYDAIHNKRP